MLLLRSNFQNSHLYIDMTTPTHVKSTLLKPFRFGAHGAKMHVASHSFSQAQSTSPSFKDVQWVYTNLHIPLGTKNLVFFVGHWVLFPRLQEK